MITTNYSVKNQIKFQIPWFYNQDYPLFVKFLEYYYEWLETFNDDQQFGLQAILDNFIKFKDFDQTLDELIPFFKNFYFRLLPDKTHSSTRLFAKRIVDLYRSKGTVKSIELLIYIILGEHASVFIPNTLLARSSNSIFGNKFFVMAKTSGSSDISFFETIKDSILLSNKTIFIENVVKINSYYQLILGIDEEFIITDNNIYYNDILIGECISLLNNVTIISSPYGIKNNSLITLNTENSLESAILLVTEVSKGIVDGSLINYGGLNYKKGDKCYSFDYNFEAEVFKVSEQGAIEEINIIKNFFFYNSIPKITIYSNTGHDADITWTSSNLGKVSKLEILNPGIDINAAEIVSLSNNKLKLSITSSYLGNQKKFWSSLNLLGNYKILPDNFLYQKFSYIVDVESSDTFISKETIRDIIHPAGFLDFYRNTISLTSSINTDIVFNSLNTETYYNQILLDLFEYNQLLKLYELIKYSNDYSFYSLDDMIVADIDKLYSYSTSEQITLEDISYINESTIDNLNISLFDSLELLT